MERGDTIRVDRAYDAVLVKTHRTVLSRKFVVEGVDDQFSSDRDVRCSYTRSVEEQTTMSLSPAPRHSYHAGKQADCWPSTPVQGKVATTTNLGPNFELIFANNWQATELVTTDEQRPSI